MNMINEEFSFNDVKMPDTTSQIFNNELDNVIYQRIETKMNECIVDRNKKNSINFAQFTSCDMKDGTLNFRCYQISSASIFIHKQTIFLFVKNDSLFPYITSNLYNFVKYMETIENEFNYKFYIQATDFILVGNNHWIYEKQFNIIIPHLLVKTLTVNTKKIMFESMDAFNEFKTMCLENNFIKQVKVGNLLTSNENLSYYIPICVEEIERKGYLKK